MWCMPNLVVLLLGLFVLAVLVGLARYVLNQFPDKVDPFILKIAEVVLVVVLVLWLLNQFCLFENLTPPARPVR